MSEIEASNMKAEFSIKDPSLLNNLSNPHKGKIIRKKIIGRNYLEEKHYPEEKKISSNKSLFSFQYNYNNS